MKKFVPLLVIITLGGALKQTPIFTFHESKFMSKPKLEVSPLRIENE